MEDIPEPGLPEGLVKSGILPVWWKKIRESRIGCFEVDFIVICKVQAYFG